MTLDYDKNSKQDTKTKKRIYKNNLIKKYSFLQRKETQSRIFSSFVSQIDEVFDENTSRMIHEQIENLQNQSWNNEVERVFNILGSRSDNSDDSDSSNKDKSDENFDSSDDDSSDSDENSDDKTDNSNRYNSIITVDKSKTKFYQKKKNHHQRQKKQHERNKKRNQNQQQ